MWAIVFTSVQISPGHQTLYRVDSFHQLFYDVNIAF